MSVTTTPREAAADHAAAPAVRNVVLVHGAFVGPSSWDKVAALLRARGFTVSAVENPLTSLGDDVAATRAVLAAQDGPTVLVGHSWGGVVIGEAGDDPKVKALVYLGAFALDRGESVGALIGGIPPTAGLRALVDPAASPAPVGAAPSSDDEAAAHLQALLGRATGVSVDPGAFPAVFAADVPLAEAQAMAATQMPLGVRAVIDVASVAAWRSKPSYYVVHADDLMIPAAAEAAFAEKIGATTIALPSSHASPVSHPREIAAFIERAATDL